VQQANDGIRKWNETNPDLLTRLAREKGFGNETFRPIYLIYRVLSGIGTHPISQGGAAACCPREISPDGAPDSSAAVASSPTRTPRLRKPPDSGLTCARLLPSAVWMIAPYRIVSPSLAMMPPSFLIVRGRMSMLPAGSKQFFADFCGVRGWR
jgi:hypothetical protein